MKSSEAFDLATRKARYGHKSWLVWKGRDGAWKAEVESTSAVRQAMLDVGTQGHWMAIARYRHIQRWRDGARILANARVGVHPNGRV